MRIITDIKIQSRNKSRCSLYLDGEFYSGLDTVTAANARLKIGDYIGEKDLSDIIATAETASAFEKAGRYSATRMRSEREIRRYLKEKEYSYPIINAVVEKMYSYRLLDDAEFCRQYIQGRPDKGTTRLRQGLLLAGVARETIDIALEEKEPCGDALFKLASKYYQKNKDVKKLYGYLIMRGFLPEEINEAISELKAEEED